MRPCICFASVASASEKQVLTTDAMDMATAVLTAKVAGGESEQARKARRVAQLKRTQSCKKDVACLVRVGESGAQKARGAVLLAGKRSSCEPVVDIVQLCARAAIATARHRRVCDTAKRGAHLLTAVKERTRKLSEPQRCRRSSGTHHVKERL